MNLPDPNLKQNWQSLVRSAGLGLIFAAAIGNIYQGFNYTVLGLYILGGSLILVWWMNNGDL